MTREEAIRRVEFCRNFLADNYSDMGESNFMALNMAIKALEQENILEKIRSEIEHMACIQYEYKLRLDREDVLKVFDKYRGE